MAALLAEVRPGLDASGFDEMDTGLQSRRRKSGASGAQEEFRPGKELGRKKKKKEPSFLEHVSLGEVQPIARPPAPPTRGRPNPALLAMQRSELGPRYISLEVQRMSSGLDIARLHGAATSRPHLHAAAAGGPHHGARAPGLPPLALPAAAAAHSQHAG